MPQLTPAVENAMNKGLAVTGRRGHYNGAKFRLFSAIYTQCGLLPHDVTAYGNCALLAVLLSGLGDAELAPLLRRNLADYIARNKISTPSMWGQAIKANEEYRLKKKMEPIDVGKDCTPLDEDHIAALGDYLGVKFVLHRLNDKDRVVTSTLQSSLPGSDKFPKLHLAYINGNHFIALLRVDKSGDVSPQKVESIMLKCYKTPAVRLGPFVFEYKSMTAFPGNKAWGLPADHWWKQTVPPGVATVTTTPSPCCEQGHHDHAGQVHSNSQQQQQQQQQQQHPILPPLQLPEPMEEDSVPYVTPVAGVDVAESMVEAPGPGLGMARSFAAVAVALPKATAKQDFNIAAHNFPDGLGRMTKRQLLEARDAANASPVPMEIEPSPALPAPPAAASVPRPPPLPLPPQSPQIQLQDNAQKPLGEEKEWQTSSLKRRTRGLKRTLSAKGKAAAEPPETNNPFGALQPQGDLHDDEDMDEDFEMPSTSKHQPKKHKRQEKGKMKRSAGEARQKTVPKQQKKVVAAAVEPPKATGDAENSEDQQRFEAKRKKLPRPSPLVEESQYQAELVSSHAEHLQKLMQQLDQLCGYDVYSGPIGSLLWMFRQQPGGDAKTLQEHMAKLLFEESKRQKKARDEAELVDSYGRLKGLINTPEEEKLASVDRFARKNPNSKQTLDNIIDEEFQITNSDAHVLVRIWKRVLDELGIDVTSLHPARVALLDSVIDKLTLTDKEGKKVLLVIILLCPISDDILTTTVLVHIISKLKETTLEAFEISATIENLLVLLRAFEQTLGKNIMAFDVNPDACGCTPFGHCTGPVTQDGLDCASAVLKKALFRYIQSRDVKISLLTACQDAAALLRAKPVQAKPKYTPVSGYFTLKDEFAAFTSVGQNKASVCPHFSLLGTYVHIPEEVEALADACASWLRGANAIIPNKQTYMRSLIVSAYVNDEFRGFADIYAQEFAAAKDVSKRHGYDDYECVNTLLHKKDFWQQAKAAVASAGVGNQQGPSNAGLALKQHQKLQSFESYTSIKVGLKQMLQDGVPEFFTQRLIDMANSATLIKQEANLVWQLYVRWLIDNGRFSEIEKLDDVFFYRVMVMVKYGEGLALEILEERKHKGDTDAVEALKYWNSFNASTAPSVDTESPSVSPFGAPPDAPTAVTPTVDPSTVPTVSPCTTPLSPSKAKHSTPASVSPAAVRAVLPRKAKSAEARKERLPPSLAKKSDYRMDVASRNLSSIVLRVYLVYLKECRLSVSELPLATDYVGMPTTLLAAAEEMLTAFKSQAALVEGRVKRLLHVLIRQEQEKYTSQEDCPRFAQRAAVKTSVALLAKLCLGEESGSVLEVLKGVQKLVPLEDGKVEEKWSNWSKLKGVFDEKDESIKKMQEIVDYMLALITKTGCALPLNVAKDANSYKQYLPFLSELLKVLEKRKELVNKRFAEANAAAASAPTTAPKEGIDPGNSTASAGSAPLKAPNKTSTKKKKKIKKKKRWYVARQQWPPTGKLKLTFDLVPGIDPHPVHVKLTKQSLPQILRDLSKDKGLKAEDKVFFDQAVAAIDNGQYWSKLFKIGKVVHGYGRPDHAAKACTGDLCLFDEVILSDGVDCIVRTTRRKSFEVWQEQQLQKSINIANGKLKSRMKTVENTEWNDDLRDRKFVPRELAFLNERDAEVAKIKQDYLDNKFDAILGLDPGQKAMATVVVHSDIAEKILTGKYSDNGTPAGERVGMEVEQADVPATSQSAGVDDNGHGPFDPGGNWYLYPQAARYSSRNISSGRYYSELGYIHRQQRIRHWMGADQGMQDWIKFAKSSKTASLDSFKKYTCTKMKHMPCMLKFYLKGGNRYRKLCLCSFFKKKHGIQKLVADILGYPPGSKAKILIAHGGSGMSNTIGCAPVGNKMFLKELRKHATVEIVGEMNTSKCCCCCFEELQGEEFQAKDEDDNPVTFESYGVRRCPNNECPRTRWNRDENGAINILHRYLRYLRGHSEPSQMVTRTARRKLQAKVVREEDLEFVVSGSGQNDD